MKEHIQELCLTKKEKERIRKYLEKQGGYKATWHGNGKRQKVEPIEDSNEYLDNDTFVDSNNFLLHDDR